MAKSLDLTRGPITKGLLNYFFPVLLGAFFQQLYNTVDAIVVGNYVGKAALAAVGGSAAQVVNLLIGFFGGLAGGATVLIAQHYGARNNAGLKSAIHTTIAFSLICGTFLTVTGILIAEPFLRILRVPEDTMEYSVQYVQLIFTGVIPGFLYNMGSGILRAMGDSRRPLYYLIVCCLTNIVLDLLFVVAFKWEVVGVALATSLSQVASAVFVLLALSKLNGDYRLRIKSLRIDRGDVGLIMKIGFPAAIQSSMYSISNLLIQSEINSFGTDTVAAWTATGKVDSVFWMIMGAFNMTVLTFVGQNIGAGQETRAHKGVRSCILMAFVTAAVISTGLFIFARPLLGIFTGDAAVKDIGVIMLHYLVPAYVMWVFVEILSGALRGAGDAFFPMLISIIGICALRLVWVYVAVPVWPGIETLCLSYPITWVVTGICFIIYYLKRGLRNRLKKA